MGEVNHFYGILFEESVGNPVRRWELLEERVDADVE
jgi:hypothetical protein